MSGASMFKHVFISCFIMTSMQRKDKWLAIVSGFLRRRIVPSKSVSNKGQASIRTLPSSLTIHQSHPSSSPLFYRYLFSFLRLQVHARCLTSTMVTPPSTPRTTSHHFASPIKPYLTLPQLISLAPLASPIISLIFVAFRLNSSSAAAQDSVEDARGALAASCLAAEHAATVGASLPRFFAEGTNAQITDAVRATMEGSRQALTLR